MTGMTSIAVLGCGRIGRMHARVIARHPKAKLACVYDVVAEAAAETSRELGVKAAASVDEIFSDPSVAGVLIATPTPTHVDLIIGAARAGKSILCEKPIDLDMARVRHCEAAIKGFRGTVMIGFNRRFDASFLALRKRVQAGEIGKVEQVIITSRDPLPPAPHFIASSGGMFRDMSIHDFDMARYIAGDVAEVHAMGSVLIDPAIGAAGDVDSSMVIMRTRSGALVHINNTRRCVYGYDQRLEVFGSNGMLLAGNQHATTVQSFNSTHTAGADVVLPFFVERYAEAYSAEIGHFIDCLGSGAAPMTSFADGVEALKIANAAQQSLETGKPVRLEQAA